jgi:hypothetical protein
MKGAMDGNGRDRPTAASAIKVHRLFFCFFVFFSFFSTYIPIVQHQLMRAAPL